MLNINFPADEMQTSYKEKLSIVLAGARETLLAVFSCRICLSRFNLDYPEGVNRGDGDARESQGVPKSARVPWLVAT